MGVDDWQGPLVQLSSTLLAVVAVGLVALAVVAVVAGEPLFAGLCMLGTTFVIYLRETRT